MKSCSIFALLLFATFSALSACAYRAEAQQGAANPAASQHEAAPTQVAASPEITAAPASSAGEVSPATAPAARPRVIALGSTLVAEFSGSLNVKKLKAGDTVKARLAQDFISGGKLIAKSGSKVLGRVTEVKRSTKDNLQSRLGVVFDKILLTKHRELDFEAIVQALAPPVMRRSRVDEPDQMMPPAVLSPNGSGPVGTNRSGHSVSSMTTLSSSVVTLGPMATVQSTPGSNPGDSLGTVQTGKTSGGRPISGGVGMHGVYGLKNLALAPPAPGTNSGPAIVSTKSDVKLQNGTQVIILVVN